MRDFFFRRSSRRLCSQTHWACRTRPLRPGSGFYLDDYTHIEATRYRNMYICDGSVLPASPIEARHEAAPEPDDFVFPFANRGKPVDPKRPCTNVAPSWWTVRKDAGVVCRSRDVRHTYASRLLEAGTSEAIVRDNDRPCRSARHPAIHPHPQEREKGGDGARFWGQSRRPTSMNPPKWSQFRSLRPILPILLILLRFSDLRVVGATGLEPVTSCV